MDQRMLTEQMDYQKFLGKVVKWVFFGVSTTAITSVIIILSGIINVVINYYFPILISSTILEIVFVLILYKKLKGHEDQISISSAKRYFLIYSIINGIVFSFILSAVSFYISALVFALTAAYFGLLYTITQYTDSNFSHIGKICLSALPILIIGYLILLFINAPLLYYGIIFLDLAIFTGITLYDMKNISTMYQMSSPESLEGIAMICAVELYLDFVNIFIDILMLIMDNN